MKLPQFSDDELGSMIIGFSDVPAFCTECGDESEECTEPDFDSTLLCSSCERHTHHKSALRLHGLI